MIDRRVCMTSAEDSMAVRPSKPKPQIFVFCWVNVPPSVRFRVIEALLV